MANGKEIPDDLMAETNEICNDLTYDHVWNQGDFLLVDNIRFMHGRRFFEKDDPRKIHIIEIERSSFGYGSTTRACIKSC